MKEYEELEYREQQEHNRLVEVTYQYESERGKLEKVEEELNELRLCYE